ncbi:M14 family zinc carboxypeptidase [Brotaphodocola sp.]|uniref:M14 family zinc carboxypeptidase n=1 Tax=Brotaphodocola sp. TaxID=3073577 RepID=UPI003D7CC6CB
MRTKNINGFLTGMLATVMVAGTSFLAQAEVIVPANELTTEVKQESPTTATTEATADATQTTAQTSPAPVTSETQASPTAPTTSETSAGTQQTTSTVVVSAGSTAQTSSAPTASSTPTPSGSTTTSGSSTGTTSPVIGPGMSSSNSVGPGIGGMLPQVAESTNTTDGTNAFAGTVTDPIVKVADKYTYDQMSQDIQKLSARYGSHMKVNVIGTSLDGRNLYEIVVGNQNAPKHILIHAGIHAREYMTPLLVMKQLEYGLAFYDSGSYNGTPLSQLFNQVAIHYVPMVNPDGISISQFGESGIRSATLRQQIRECYENDKALGRTSATYERYLLYWKADARGTDLNQNFPADWDQVSSSPKPSYGTYKGTSSLSEPESQALANLAMSRNWALTISYHSMGNLIYWDYAGNKVKETSKALADLMASKTGYRLGGSSGHGGFKDWVQIKDSPIPSVTIEVGSVTCPMPVSEFPAVWQHNKEVWVSAMEFAIQH